MRTLPMVVFALLAGCSGRSEPPATDAAPSAAEEVKVVSEAPREEKREMSRDCTGKKIAVGEGDNVLDEARSAGVEAPDFFPSYAAATIDVGTAKSMAVTASYLVSGRALLWIVDGSVVVDRAVFPDGLKTAELTTMTAGARASLGRIEPSALDELGMTALAEFLMHARVVGTWIHIGAELCPVAVEETSEQAVAYAGTHTYFTNEENVDEVAFILRVSPNGDIDIEAR